MKNKNIIVLLLLIIIASFSSSIFSWFGYGKWKYRRDTYGDINESKQRNVFIKGLEYKSNIDIDSFNVYIEKGYKYGFWGSNETRIFSNTNYPYQVTFTERLNNGKTCFYIVNKKVFDSVTEINVYLKNKYLNDTLIIGIEKYNSGWDSIGYIKVWDAPPNEHKE